MQHYLTGTLESYLSNTLKTKVRIESIRLRLPESLVLEGVYVEDIQEDTLLHVDEFSVNFKLNKLLQKRIQFDQIYLKGGQGKLYFGRETSNIDFISNASSEGEETDEASSPWFMTFDNAGLLIQKVKFEYVDEKAAINLSTAIGEMKGSIDHLDYLKNDYQIDQVLLNNSQVKINLGEAQTEEKMELDEPSIFKINARKIDLEKVDVDFSMPDMEIVAGIGELELSKGSFYMFGDDMKISAKDFKLEESRFKYDIISAEKIEAGFDPKHYGIENLMAEISDFNYDNLDISAAIKRVSGQSLDGFSLKNLEGEINFRNNKITLRETALITTDIRLQSKETSIEYPFSGESESPLEQLKIKTDIEAESDGLRELSYFYPPLDSIVFFQKNREKPFKIKAISEGSLSEMNIYLLDFKGLGTLINLNGKVKSIIQPDRLEFDLLLPHFLSSGEAILNILPDSTLPTYVHLPDSISLAGNIKGNIADFVSEIKVETKRRTLPHPTRFDAIVQVKDIQKKDSAFFDILLDTFVISKPDLLAYLPSNTLPEYVDLPDQFILTGKPVQGPLYDISSSLELNTIRAAEKKQYDFSGDISGAFSDQPAFDLGLFAYDIDHSELKHFVPDSLLPDYFKLPVFKNITGKIKGKLNDLQANIKFGSNTGEWEMEGVLQKERFEFELGVNNFQAASFFVEKYLDSLLGFPIHPLALEMKLSGEGFDLSEKTYANLSLNVKSADDTTAAGLLIEGKLAQQVLTAHASASEPEIGLNSELSLDLSKALPKLFFDLQLDQLDLQALHISEQPFSLNGKLFLEAEGMNFDTFSGTLLMDSFNIHFAEKSERIDSLLLTAELNNRENTIQISSDFLEATLDGKFSISEIDKSLKQMVFSPWRPNYPDSLLGNTDEYFDFDFQLHRPEILTMGYIPTLDALSPFHLAAKYDNRSTALSLHTNIPFFNFQQSDFEDLSVDIQRNKEGFDYHLSLHHANIRNLAEVENLKTFGSLRNQLLMNTIEMLDEKEKEYFSIKSSLSFLENQTYEFSFLPDQLLNYENWQVTKGNAIRWSPEEVDVRDWYFSRDESAIEITTEKEEEQVQVAFDQFDLNTVSNIIKLNSDYLGGILNGHVSAKSIQSDPAFFARLHVDSLMVMKAQLGDFSVQVDDKNNQIFTASASLQGNGNDLSLQGELDLNDEFESLDFSLDIPSVNLAAIEPLTFGYLENMAGTLASNLKITGNFAQPSVEGKVHFDEAAFDIEMLKTRLRLGKQPVIFDANAIEFKDLEILDANGNKGVVSSYILTSDFREYFLQAEVGMKDFLVLNTNSKDNDLYYGKLLVDADVKLSGLLTSPTVDVVAKPKKDSRLTYVYNPYSNDLITDEGVVEFIQPKSDIYVPKPNYKTRIQEVSENLNMKITVRAEVNENLDFKAITDPFSGDNFQGKTKGDIVFVMLPDGTMELNGQLEAVEGKYLFTYQKLVRRPFKVKPGGTLSWTGDPFNPELDIDVEYQVRTSAYPLLARSSDDETAASTSQKQVFLVNLNIGGLPSKTEISTSISYPNDIEGNTGDGEIQSAIASINQDPNQQNTQAFALILFNGFLSQNLGNSDFQILDLSGDLNNVISQRLNNLANRYIKFVEVDFGLDTYQNSNDLSQTDFKVSIRKRLLNDRLLISLDGKTTTESGTEQSSSQTYLDNVTVEYSLTQNGRFKIKLYNQRDFDDFIGGTAVKLGGILVFSKDFHGLRWQKKRNEDDGK
ncbi:MAG: translocation/assembly module TamB [Chitinophagales bacterium]|nr:translocation/assembly module TamB [Chitinophagales bacterium]